MAAYGSNDGVQAILRPVINTISTTSEVTTTDVTSELTSLSLVIDAVLAAAGYVTPVTATDAEAILDRVANLKCAAAMLERLIMGVNPTSDRVSVASVWRKEAQSILDAAVTGTAPLPGVTYTAGAGGASDLPGVSSEASVLDYDDTTGAFVEDYGGVV